MNAEYDACILSQPVLDPGAVTERDLPVNLLRKCCPGKSCGNTELYLQIVGDPPTGNHIYSYRRVSNDDPYWQPVRTLPELVELLNLRSCWPVNEDLLDALYGR